MEQQQQNQPKLMRAFNTGATRDNNEDKLDYHGFTSARATRKFAEYMHRHRRQNDGTLRASDNWKRGIPIAAYIESMVRHIQEFREAVEDGDYDKADEIAPAIWFNIQGYIHEREKLKDAELPPCE